MLVDFGLSRPDGHPVLRRPRRLGHRGGRGGFGLRRERRPAASLAGANTLTGTQTVASAAAANLVGLLVQNNAAASAANQCTVTANLVSSGGLITSSRIRTDLTILTGGAEQSRVRIDSLVAGTLAAALTIDGSTLTNRAGNKIDAFPSGTRLDFGSAIPTLWTADPVANSSVVRLAKTGETPNASGGTSDVFASWATQDHTLTLPEIPSHTHVERVTGPIGGGGGVHPDVFTTGFSSQSSDLATDAAGGGAAHSHVIATPYYRIRMPATKNA